MDASLFSHSSDSYDSTMFSYSMGPLGSLKPGLLGIAPLIPGIAHMKGAESLTPRQQTTTSNCSNHTDLVQEPSDRDRAECKASLYQQLATIEQALLNRAPVHISQLLALFTDKQVSFCPFVDFVCCVDNVFYC